MRDLILYSGIALLMFACARAAGVRPEIEEAAKAFIPPHGMARIYVFRASSLYGAGELIEIDVGNISGVLDPKSFLLADLAPGYYQVRSRSMGVSTAGIAVEADRSYFVRVSYLLSPKIVDATEGRRAVRARKMAWSSAFPAESAK